MANLPTGTVTFLFTDVEGSTKLWERFPDTMKAAIARHDVILRGAIEAHRGYVFKTVGDAFCTVFWTAPEALRATLAFQRAFFAEDWGEVGPIRVRAALHTGAVDERDVDYFGPAVNRVARLLSAGHGGQSLVSLPTHELIRDRLPERITLRDLGEHGLKDLSRPEQVFQIVAPDLPDSFPALKTLDSHPNNLPVQPTPLVGREAEVAAAAQRLRRADVRLLTFTGPGGIGKTRLALQAAAELAPDFEDGVFFVPLASLADPSQVPLAIAQVVGVKLSSDQPTADSLAESLQGRQILLLLDNFEHLEAAAALAADLLARCPRLKILVTSRVILHLRGEHEFAVPPLSLPDRSHLPPPEQLIHYEAIRLFVERTRTMRPEFAVTEQNASAVVEICYRLDALPLAIELAAPWIKIFPPSTLLARLENRLKVLTGGARDLPIRQQTLRNTIAWSYDLLDEWERKLFRSLAVFNGGCTLEAAIAVCSEPAGADGDEDAVLAGLASLTDKSLVREIETPTGSGDPESRFRLLQTVREFALEYLAATSEAGEIGRRHAEYYLALAEKVRAASGYSVEPTRRHALEREHNNLRAALRWAEETKSDLHPRLVEVVDWFGRILVATFQAEDVASDYERRLTKARRDGDRREELRALIGLVEASYVLALDDQTGRASARARECFVEGERLARSIGDRSGLTRLLIASVQYHGFWPDFASQADLNAREAIELSRAIGDEDLQIGATIVGWRVNRREEAENQSRALVRLLTDRADFARLNYHYFELMLAYLFWGDLKRCIEVVDIGTRLAERIGVPPVQYATLKALALLNLGRFGEARAALQREVADEAHLFGRAYRDLGSATYLFDVRAYEQAATMFRDVEERASRLGRTWMVQCARAGLVASLLRRGRLAAATSVNVVDEADDFANRTFKVAVSDPRIELALAQKRFDDAYNLAEDVARATKRRDGRLSLVRARETMVRALCLREQNQEAITLADATLALAEEHGYLPLVWQLRAMKALACERLGRSTEAVAEYRRAADIVRVLADSIDDAELRQTFLGDSEIADVVARGTQ